jgi:siroheme synthase-like protein
LDFTGRWALLIGAGAVGRRKLAALLEAGAKVRVVEPDPAPWLLELAAEGLLLLEKKFSERFLDDGPWVFLAAAGGDEGQERQAARVLELAKERGLWLNAASHPKESGFFLPAVASDEPFRLTVSTGGSSPALAARVAKDLKAAYQGYGALCQLLARVRPVVLGSGLPEADRKRIFQDLADDPRLAGLIKTGEADLLRERLNGLLAPLSLPEGFPL